MRSMGFEEIRGLLGSSSFQSWYAEYQVFLNKTRKLVVRLRELQVELTLLAAEAEHHQRRGEECFFQIVEYEELAAQAQVDHDHHENDSYELLGAFEQQRRRATAAWVRCDSVEERLQDGSSVIKRVKERIPRVYRPHLSIEAGSQPQGPKRARKCGAAQQVLEVETRRRDELWEEVESSWNLSFVSNVNRSVYELKRHQLRAEAERLFSIADQKQTRIERLHQSLRDVESCQLEVDGGLRQLIAKAQAHFSCVMVEGFVFWPSSHDVHEAICVPLVDELEHCNIQLRALRLYRTDRSRALDWLEPVASAHDEVSEDHRKGVSQCSGSDSV